MARKQQPAFEVGKSQMFAILTPETPQAKPQLWMYTTFFCVGDAEAFIKQRCEQFGRAPEGFTIVPCETTVRISHYPEVLPCAECGGKRIVPNFACTDPASPDLTKPCPVCQPTGVRK